MLYMGKCLTRNTLMYWVCQKVHPGFSIIAYRKNQMNFLANPNNTAWERSKGGFWQWSGAGHIALHQSGPVEAMWGAEPGAGEAWCPAEAGCVPNLEPGSESLAFHCLSRPLVVNVSNNCYRKKMARAQNIFSEQDRKVNLELTDNWTITLYWQIKRGKSYD